MQDLFGKTEKFFPAKEIKIPDFSSFVAFDIETTGLPRNSQIIEIGAVKVINGVITEAFSELVDPGITIPYYITQLTGITDEMVNGAGKISEVMPEFKKFAGNNILVGHNAIGFDCKVMGHWADEYGIYIGNDVFDTLRFLRYRCEPFPDMQSKNLGCLCDYFHINADNYHRAAADAEMTAKLYFELQKKAKLKK